MRRTNIPVRSITPPGNESDRSESFTIRDVRTLLGGNDMVQNLHRHNFFFVLALTKGAGSHEIDFVRYEMRDNSVFLLRPGQVHRLTLKEGSSGFLMEFEKDFYHGHGKLSADLLRKATSKTLCELHMHVFDRLLPILDSIFQEYSDKLEGYQEVIKASVGIFLIEILRNRKSAEDRSGRVNSYAQERLEKLLELVEEHISTHKKVSQYADMLNISPYQVNAICKEMLNKTCSEVINDHIILESKRQLLATARQVNEIAFQLGYEDVSYFIRLFKKHTGFTPEAFRQNFR